MFVLQARNLGRDTKVFEYAFEAASTKEASKFVSEFISHCWFKQKDLSFTLLKQQGMTYEKV